MLSINTFNSPYDNGPAVITADLYTGKYIRLEQIDDPITEIFYFIYNTFLGL
jgi:hypothetical protein